MDVLSKGRVFDDSCSGSFNTIVYKVFLKISQIEIYTHDIMISLTAHAHVSQYEYTQVQLAKFGALIMKYKL